MKNTHIGRDFFASFPLRVFVATRLGLFLLAYGGMLFLPVQSPEGVMGPLRPFPDNMFLDPWCRWDANWYRDIAVNGYSVTPRFWQQANLGFFPLYPMLMRLMAFLVGDSYVAGLIISNLCFLGALFALFSLVKKRWGEELAKKVILLWACSPFSFFFEAPYSESLWVWLTISAFHFGENKKWRAAAACAALSAATRITGLHVLLALFILYLEQIEFKIRKVRWNILYILVIGPLGILVYAAFCYKLSGNPIYFINGRSVPGWSMRGIADIPPLFATTSIKSILAGTFPAHSWICIFMCLLGLVLSTMYLKRVGIAYALLTVSVLLTSILTVWSAMPRHFTALFPIFIYLAMLLKNETAYYSTIAVSLLFLSLFTLMYGHWHWVA